MARIFFIRHGQASFLKADYDQLTELGRKQAYSLGQYWAGSSLPVARIYTGELKRQKQTAEAFLKGAQLEVTVCTDSGFDEHHGPEIVKPYYPDRFFLDREVPEEDFDKMRRFFYGTYFKLALPWIKGELDPQKIGHIEPWADFRSRFRKSLKSVLDTCPRGGNVLIFTSVGPVWASMGEVLDLDDEKTIRLGWQVKNTSITEYLYGKDRMSLVSFNEIPHLKKPSVVTLV